MDTYGMQQLEQAIASYMADWRALVQKRAGKDFFVTLQPMSVGWKVADNAAFDDMVAGLRDSCDQVHMIRKNNRWLATMHLKDTSLPRGIMVVNVMQRRPDSQDATGLDNVSFYTPHFARTETVLADEPDLKWTRESNGPYSSWISLWFAGTEAKLRDRSVLDVSIDELRYVRDEIMKGKA